MVGDVVGVGARGAVGLSALQVALNVRARKFEPKSISQRDRNGHEIGVALAPGLGEHVTGYPRLLGLGGPALAEAVFDAGAEVAKGALPVVVVLPEAQRADDGPELRDGWLRALEARSGVVLDHARSSVVRGGHAGFARAVARAVELLGGGAPFVAVGGVESYYHAAVLRELDASLRLHGLDTEDGMIPSEAAAFLILGRGGTVTRRRHGRLLHVAFADEPAARDESLVNTGSAMTELVAEALGACSPLAWVVTDENGERHRQEEWQKVALRRLHGVTRTVLPRDTGDVGAATGALAAVTVLVWGQLGCAQAPRALLAMHSESGERGVLVVEVSLG